jgi:hypothetical protein
MIPLMWAVLFVTFGALGADFFSFSGQGTFLDKLVIQPLVTIAMLILAITLPRSLAKAALLGALTPGLTGGARGGGGGFMGRTAQLCGGPAPRRRHRAVRADGARWTRRRRVEGRRWRRRRARQPDHAGQAPSTTSGRRRSAPTAQARPT